MPRIRVEYEKKGWIIFLNHMDLPTVFSRAARRAELSQEFTQGFSPHPRISLGPALSIGVEGFSETADFWFNEWDETAAERWSAQLPEGLRIISTREVPTDGPNLGKCINAAEYVIKTTGFRLDEEIMNLLVEALKVNGTVYCSEYREEENEIILSFGGLEKNTPSLLVKTLTEHGKCEGWADFRFTRTIVGYWNQEKQTILKA